MGGGKYEFEKIITLSDHIKIVVKIDKEFIYIAQEQGELGILEIIVLTHNEWKRLKEAIEEYFRNKKERENIDTYNVIEELYEYV